MFRLAVVLFVAVVALLLALALQPSRERQLPPGDIVLEGASVVLYPQSDPEAVWRFEAPRVSYAPETGETTLLAIRDGRRDVAGETDFTVQSERLVIDRRDDLSGELVYAHLLDSGDCLTMRADGGTPVIIDQADGLFLVPQMQIEGDAWGSDNSWQRVRASFDLQTFEAGGMGTTTTNEFRVGADDGDPARSTLCDAS